MSHELGYYAEKIDALTHCGPVSEEEAIRRLVAMHIMDPPPPARESHELDYLLADDLKPAKARLTTDSAARKDVPIFSGVLAYFPDAIADVARLSKIGNDKHNPGQPLHWSRGKSDDHADCLIRHQIENGIIDTDGVLHDAKVAWRALAQLQLAIEKLRAAGVDY